MKTPWFQFYAALSILLLPIPTPAQEMIHISSGTGFYVTSRFIVTNEHVVQNCQEINLVGATDTAKATLYVANKEQDLAILVTNQPPQFIASMRANPGIKKGDLVHVIGYPGVQEKERSKYSLRRAKILNIKANGYIEFTAVAEHGFSGGPLIDAHGNVIGVVVANLYYFLHTENQETPTEKDHSKADKTTSLAIGLDALNAFLKKHKIYTRVQSSYDIFMDFQPDKRAKKYLINIQCIQK
jgi:hypothetical protein